jgi:hypothetical protein
MGLFQRLAKVALHSRGQHLLFDSVIRKGSNQDRWDRPLCFDELLVKFDTRYFRHVYIGDEARSGSDFGGSEKFDSGGERRNVVAQRPKQPSQGVAKGLVVINDRDK